MSPLSWMVPVTIDDARIDQLAIAVSTPLVCLHEQSYSVIIQRAASTASTSHIIHSCSLVKAICSPWALLVPCSLHINHRQSWLTVATAWCCNFVAGCLKTDTLLGANTNRSCKDILLRVKTRSSPCAGLFGLVPGGVFDDQAFCLR